MKGKILFVEGWIEMILVWMQYYADEHCMDVKRI